MTYKVLIVDDSKLARMAAAKVLKSCCPDWPRVEAGSAADALTAMEADAPDIALVDYNMPAQDGLHLVEGLRKLNPDMPIAVISANHQQEVVNRATALGAIFLPKPLAQAALDDFLKVAVRGLKVKE
jgi:DNA-binding NarL/FixJ family response regulator